jgi:beta-mannosidase
VTIARRGSCSVAALHARAELHGPGGELHVEAEIALGPDASDVELHAVVDDQAVALAPVESGGGRLRVRGTIPLHAVQPWWPHSHGEPRLYELTIEDRGAAPRVLARRRIGFRTVELHADAERGFALLVNGERIFCRGVCWSPLSLTRLHGRRADYVEALTALRDAGANMIRVSGTMVYEAEAFHDLCDELGILVWQDFMFANMDYPVDDGFLAGAAREARQVAGRLVRHPSLALLCGNSEVHQQVGMLGLSPELWQSRLFDEVLPAVCAEVCPDVPYRPSSPSGGALAFHVDAGDSHYFGVGAWLRPTSDGRHSGVRFASECLGFANVPGDDTIDLVAGPGELAVHHPRWKAGTPRDPGAGWDFEDVRDHYLQALFGVDPLALRRSDMPRYLALSRVASGEVMAEVFAGWRAAGSRCNGGLVWLFQDLVPGAGWGIRDSCGRPKAAYYHLKRAWASRTAFLLDDGLNGARLHVLNDGPAPCEVSVNVAAWRYGGSLVREASTALSLAPRDARELSVDAMLGGFLDTTYAYRFGPPAHDVLHAVLTADDHDGPLAEAFLFAHGRPTAVEHDIGLGAELERGAGEDAILRLETRHFAQSVEIRSPGYAPADNYFHLAPGSRRAIALQRTAAVAPPSVTVQALNAAMPVRLQAREPVGA